jgi:hypothetical protein
MKRYVPIVIGVLALCAVLYVGSGVMKNNDEKKITTDEQKSEVSTKSFQGSFTKEGSTTLQYGFDLPETATATVSMDGALVKVTDTDAPVLAMYVSYEGTRGYTPEDYITHVIVPKVSAVTNADPVTIGSFEWSVVESEFSIWHVAKTEDGKWLLVVENKKADAEKANTILESVSAK